MNTKIAIAVPCNRVIKPKTMQCLLELSQSDYDFKFIVSTEGYTISENRNYCVAQASKAGCEYLLFIDDDMTFPPDTLDKLLSHQKDIVGTVASSRMITDATHIEDLEGRVFKKQDIPTEPFQAKAVGTGVMLIRMSIFNQIERPFFTTETHENGFTTMGEDYWFCRQARNKDIEIWIDPTIQIGHLGDYIY